MGTVVQSKRSRAWRLLRTYRNGVSPLSTPKMQNLFSCRKKDMMCAFTLCRATQLHPSLFINTYLNNYLASCLKLILRYRYLDQSFPATCMNGGASQWVKNTPKNRLSKLVLFGTRNPCTKKCITRMGTCER